MGFIQAPPELGNQFHDDPVLPRYLARVLPPATLAAITPDLAALGGEAEAWRQFQLADRDNEPVLTQWDAWGNRIDRIEVSPLWKAAARLAAERGLVAAGYDPVHGPWARTHQFALVHVIAPSLDVYACPLAMTDGAAKTLREQATDGRYADVVGHLLARDPAHAWTSGQWMTERTGGSDVSQTETVAKRAPDGSWRLYGTKWFTSATTSEVALTLARPEGNPDGSRGLAMFLIELRDAAGRLRGIEVNRLKDKLGTRKVPTAELQLVGAPATLIGELQDGVRAITPMLSVTRTWNSIVAVSLMRRAVALARAYAHKRKAFGAMLVDKPLHVDTLAGLEAEYAGATLLAFRLADLLGRSEHPGTTEHELQMLRFITPLAKLATAKQAMQVVSEAIECFGGAGYVEDTGMARLLADTQVLPIWEGTTNVLSLDALRALAKGGVAETVRAELAACVAGIDAPALQGAVQLAGQALDQAMTWLADAMTAPARLEAGARRFALTVARALELGYLCQHAGWALTTDAGGVREVALARRFAAHGASVLTEVDVADSAAILA